MATTPVYEQGRHITTLSIQPLSQAASGLFSDFGNAQSLVTSVDEIRRSQNVITESIVALTSEFENEVPIEVGDSLEIGEILKSAENAAYNPTSPLYNVLEGLWALHFQSGIHHARVTRIGAGRTFIFTGLIQNYHKTGRKGKNTGRMTFLIVDTDTVNPSYTG